ncbi:hypothetical protein FEE95_12520 [Maribacter algarum]|uniref:Uncharacterized protein n=1 Tax=Maribacter algarum (ex Zhang et al. 2020) TaxID=2578118 RepID=A0A5S3PTQ4_9FLAO|nr:hypothetical protein [Maribacter algarum]TMM57303.1 hypothetical protein FEE95_12520 [Maribacter algarum]
MILTEIKLRLLSIACFLGITALVSAQERFEYQGPLQVQNYTGDALYSYKIVENDTLLDGPFQLKRSSLQALLEKQDISFLFKGKFTDGVATDAWRFQFGEFQSDSQSNVVNFEYRVLISGRQEEGSGDLKNGKPDGLWTYQVNQIKDSEKEKRLFKSDITFENGVPQRNFQIENEDVILVGRFLRNGLAHDEWTSYNVNVIENTESWFFEEGLLRKIQQIDEDGIEKDIPVYGINEDDYEIINLDKDFIEVLRISLGPGQISESFSEGLPNVLAANAGYYEKIDGILSKLGTSDFKPKFKVQVPSFPLDTLEQANLKILVTEYKKAEEISKSLLNNSHLNILKRSDENTQFYYNCIAKIQKDFLDPTKDFVRLGRRDLLQFIKRDTYISRIWSKTRPSTVINVSIDSIGTQKSFLLPNASDLDFTGNDIATIKQLVSYANLSLNSIKNKLSEQLFNAEQEQELIDLEERLILKNEALMEQIDSVKATLPIEYAKALQNIQNLADESLSKYALIEDSKEKFQYGTIINNCFTHLSNLSSSVAELPTQVIEIDSLYQDSVWNPFMAVLMDEDVKKRLTSAYKKVLVPYFLKTASQELNCESIVVLENEIQGSYQKMLLLREEDTKKLERKLRREENPKTIIQLFNVQPIKAEE